MGSIPDHLRAPVEITGWGMCVPERVVTNEELARDTGLDTSDEWIVTRTGIRQRHITDGTQATSDLAVGAAGGALSRAALEPADVDLIIVATATPDHVTPSTSCLVQERLGARRAHGFDLNAGCTGFLSGLRWRARTLRLAWAATFSSSAPSWPPASSTGACGRAPCSSGMERER